MRQGWWLVAIVTLAAVALAADQGQNLGLLSCASVSSTDPACNPSKEDLKKSKADFAKALKLQKAERFEQAFEEFDSAARLAPKNVEYVTALALARQQLVFDHLRRGNENLARGKMVEAQAEFRSASNLDPQNEFAQQRLRDSLTEWAPKINGTPQVVAESEPLRVVPDTQTHEFHFRGDSRALLTQVPAAFGVAAEFDESVPTRRVHFDLDSADFYTAMRAACSVTGAFWVPLSEKQIFLAKETTENHRQFDRMAMRTFYLPGATTPQDLTEMTSLMRTIFDIRFVSQQPQAGKLVVRAPTEVLDAVTRVVEGLGDLRPQILLDVQIFQVDHQLTRAMGIHIPNDFTLINIPAAALLAVSGLGGQNIQNLINQFISGGGINATNSQGLAGLLSQLQGQQNSLFSQPVATFGGGLTLMGVTLDTLSAELSLNESWLKALEHATLRASQGNDATFRMGSRYPILNASFAPVFNTPAISQVLQNGSFQEPFPSFSYEDLGLTLKAKPQIYANSDVGLGFEMDFRTLAGQSLNGVPVISNREYKGSFTLRDGEPAVVAGSISQNEQRSLNGIPGLGGIPGVNKIMASNSKTEQADELLVVITPHIIDASRKQSTEIWLSRSGR